jgi:hypothetical protein
VSYCPHSSLPDDVLAWLAVSPVLSHPPRPPGRGGTPPLALEVRLDAVGAVLLDGLSYRRAGRAVGISKTEVGDSMDLLLPKLAALGFCQPDGTFITTLADLGGHLEEMALSGEAVCVDGWRPGCSDPAGGATRRCYTTPSGMPTPPRAWRCSPSTATCCGATAAGLAAATSRSWWRYRGLGSVLDAADVATLLDRGFRGLAKPREHWHAPVGDRRTNDQLTDGQRAFNRVQARLRALVEQSIGHLADAWALRRWRGLLYRVRDVFRAAGALVCLGRWLHRVPSCQALSASSRLISEGWPWRTSSGQVPAVTGSAVA